MFESASIRRSAAANQKREILKRGVSLLISLAVHGAVLSLLVIYYAPLKILDFSGDVRDVFIAPPVDQLFLPETGPEQRRGEADRSSLSSEPSSQVLAEAVSPEVGQVSEPSEPGPSEPLSASPRFTENFRLNPSPSTPSELPEGVSFQLVPERKTRSYSYAPPEKRALPSGALSQYIHPSPVLTDTMNSRISPGSPPGGYSSFPNKPEASRADISQWADRAVAKILDNWFIPLQVLDQEDDEFEIAVMVQKDGWIASTEVVRPARVRPLQAAALKALELSSPLPRLPRTFPEKSLEIRLVFERK
jgi:hypothetical protein